MSPCIYSFIHSSISVLGFAVRLKIPGPLRALHLVPPSPRCEFLGAMTTSELPMCPTHTHKPLLIQQIWTKEPPLIGPGRLQ